MSVGDRKIVKRTSVVLVSRSDNVTLCVLYLSLCMMLYTRSFLFFP